MGSRPSWASLGLDLVSLRVLIAAVEEGGITAAAEREGIAISAVSRRISELEGRCGVKLLERGERGTQPTPAGQRIIDQVFTIFDQLDVLARDIDSMKGGKTGLIRLHTHMSAIAGGLPQLLASFAAANPGIDVEVEELTSVEVMHAVQTGTADLGLVSGTLPADGLAVIPWREDELVLILPYDHPLASHQTLLFSAVVDEPFIGMQRDSALFQLYRQHAKVLGRKLVERVHATSFESVRNMVAAGFGIAILPRLAVEPHTSNPKIAVCRLDESWARRPLKLCVRNHQHVSAATQRLIDHLCAAAEI